MVMVTWLHKPSCHHHYTTLSTCGSVCAHHHITHTAMFLSKTSALLLGGKITRNPSGRVENDAIATEVKPRLLLCHLRFQTYSEVVFVQRPNCWTKVGKNWTRVLKDRPARYTLKVVTNWPISQRYKWTVDDGPMELATVTANRQNVRQWWWTVWHKGQCMVCAVFKEHYTLDWELQLSCTETVIHLTDCIKGRHSVWCCWT